LIIIRGFARYRFGADPNTEIPPIGLLRFRSRRAQPYIYSHDEICSLLQAAMKIESPHKLQPHTYHCLFGLLAVSGLRLGEAVSLQPQDVDWSEGVLTVRGKFGKTRLVPLHPSTLAVLRDYADLRDKIFNGRILPTFLVTSRGTKLEKPISAASSVSCRGRSASASQVCETVHGCMTSDTIPRAGLSRVVACRPLFPRILEKDTRHSPNNVTGTRCWGSWRPQ